MATHKLDNYLRTYRKRASLSQDEIAYLLGTRDGTRASRYERFARRPSLETALAYQAIFRAPVSDLFAGVYQGAETRTIRRARLLHKRLGKDARCPAAKLKLLNDLAGHERSERNAAA